MRLRTGLAAASLVLLPLAACAPAEDSGGSATDDDTSAAPTSGSASAGEPTSGSAGPTEPTDAAGALPPECAPDQLTLVNGGKLTVGTDKPAYDPWFSDNDPTNGQGFESAVAYAVAERLGFTADQVSWTVVPFNTSYKPGAKDFDFDINQISITPERAEVVDFSEGYYTATQAVVALAGSDIADASSIDELSSYRLGAQTGTTSLTVARDLNDSPAVFEDTNAAKQALVNGQVDGIVADLPTAFYISAAEIDDSVIVGQFENPNDDPEEFGMLFEKGNPLVSCVDAALEAMKADGTLDGLQQQWLSDAVDVPVLQ